MLVGMLMYFPVICQRLRITVGQITWEFIPTSDEVPENTDPTVAYFNVGGADKKWDQHGKPDNESLCKKCSLDFVRGQYDFLRYRKWLVDVYQLVRNNDVKGSRISRHPFNLRELMTAMSHRHRNVPKLVLDWLALAFCGVFENCKAGVNIKEVFDPKLISAGVEAYCQRTDQPEQIAWFDKLITGAIQTLKDHWKMAQEAVQRAEKAEACREVFVPALDQYVKVIEVWCDSFKTGAAGRQSGYHIVVQRTRDGHCQIHGGTVSKIDGQRKWLHLGQVAKVLRQLEARACQKAIRAGQDLSKNGDVLFDDKTKIPWYLPEFLTSCYNGTLSNNVKVTRLSKGVVFEALCNALPICDIVVENGDERWVEETEQEGVA
jgi:hypothetical protein